MEPSLLAKIRFGWSRAGLQCKGAKERQEKMGRL